MRIAIYIDIHIRRQIWVRPSQSVHKINGFFWKQKKVLRIALYFYIIFV